MANRNDALADTATTGVGTLLLIGGVLAAVTGFGLFLGIGMAIGGSWLLSRRNHFRGGRR